MNRCSKCDILQEDNQFATYWHSTQNKFRTRRICKGCISKQKKEYKEMLKLKKQSNEKIEVEVFIPEVVVDYSNNPDYKKCNKCKEYKHIDNDYYKYQNRSLTQCIACEKKHDKEKRDKYLSENCGGDRVPNKPNIYKDKYQKACTFEMMEALGYLYNEEKGVWLKDGWKELIDGKIVFPNLGYTVRKGIKYTEKKKEKTIQMYLLGLSQSQISKEINIAKTSVNKHINEWKKSTSK